MSNKKTHLEIDMRQQCLAYVLLKVDFVISNVRKKGSKTGGCHEIQML